MHTHVRYTSMEMPDSLAVLPQSRLSALSPQGRHALLAAARQAMTMLLLTAALIVAVLTVPAASTQALQKIAGSSPQVQFVAAVYSADVLSMRSALENGANVDAADATGTTPLMIAAHFADDGPALFLLQRGAHPDRADLSGTTPLMYAARADRPLIARQLLLAGADLTAKDLAGNDALAIARTHGGWQVADILEEAMLAHPGH